MVTVRVNRRAELPQAPVDLLEGARLGDETRHHPVDRRVGGLLLAVGAPEPLEHLDDFRERRHDISGARTLVQEALMGVERHAGRAGLVVEQRVDLAAVEGVHDLALVALFLGPLDHFAVGVTDASTGELAALDTVLLEAVHQPVDRGCGHFREPFDHRNDLGVSGGDLRIQTADVHLVAPHENRV